MDFTVLVHAQAIPVGDRLGRRQILSGLGAVTFGAGIDEVVVVTLNIVVFTLRKEVVNLVVAPQGQPRLATETIDATEGKFVAEPVSVLAIFGIALWSVPADVRPRRIDKWRGEIH